MLMDDEIIAILFVFFIITVAWRYFFRWDSRNRLRTPGLNREGGIEFRPPFPRAANETIAVVSSARWNLAIRCTWLVQGLLAAGFRVVLLAETSSLIKNLEQNDVHDVIFYNSYSNVKKTVHVLQQGRESGVKRAILVNFGGSYGLKNIRSGMLDAGAPIVQQETSVYLISETKVVAIPDVEQGLFKEMLLVQRSRGHLRDAELLVIGTILRWLA